jgi:hypothetical protein
MSYILNGKFYQGNIPIAQTESSQYKEWNHDQQRRDHKADLVQTYTKDGKPNDEFIQLYPAEAKQYGFIKE